MENGREADDDELSAEVSLHEKVTYINTVAKYYKLTNYVRLFAGIKLIL